MSPVKQLALSVVMPVYNEALGLDTVIDDVVRAVLDVVPDSELVVVDDHSSDDTPSVLQRRADLDPRIRVVRNDVNRGHGPSVRRAIDASAGRWVFHIDSDGQVDLDEFGMLWSARDGNDLLLGIRAVRHDPLHRLVLTRFTRVVCSVLALGWVRDANVPFKLFRRDLFDHLATSMPPDTFAPSLLVVIGAHRAKARIAEFEITHLARAHGRSTLRLGRLARAAALACGQTVRFGIGRFRQFQPR